MRRLGLILTLLLPMPAAAQPPRLGALDDSPPAGALVPVGSTQMRPGGAVAFTRDGASLVIAHWSGGVDVWDIATGKVVHRLPARAGSENWLLDIAPDGRHVATVNTKGLCRVIRLPKGNEVLVVGGGDAPHVHQVRFSADGRCLVLLRSDRTVEVYELATGKRRTAFVLEELTATHPGLAIGPGGDLLVTARLGKVLRVNLHTGKVTQALTCTQSRQFSDAVAVSADGSRVAAASIHGEAVDIWDAATGKLLATRPFTGDCLALAFTPDAGGLFVSDHRGNFRLWDYAADEDVQTFGGHGGRPWSLALAPDGKLLATSDATEARLWRLDMAPEREQRESAKEAKGP